DKQCRQQIASLAFAQSQDFRIGGRTFDAAVPTKVLVEAVAVALAVRLIVLVVVRDQVPESETVVTGNEIDRMQRGAFAAFVKIGAAANARREISNHS